MKQIFFPTDAGDRPKFGTFFSFDDRYATLQDAFNAGCPVLEFLHGVGSEDCGNGTLLELKQYAGMTMFKNGFWQSIAVKNIIIAQVQSATGLWKAGEIQFLRDKVKGYNPRRKPAIEGFSGGGFGLITNVENGTLDPIDYSSMWMLSPGGNGNIGTGFAAKMKDKNCKLYLIHNQNDKIALVVQSQKIFDSMKVAGLPVSFIKFLNVWTSSDGNTSSHATPGMVFNSWEWRMYSTDIAARDSKRFADVYSAAGGILPVYDMYQRFIDDLPGLPDPAPVPDKMLLTEQIWERPDGTFYSIFI